jgi:hypothetical protein
MRPFKLRSEIQVMSIGLPARGRRNYGVRWLVYNLLVCSEIWLEQPLPANSCVLVLCTFKCVAIQSQLKVKEEQVKALQTQAALLREVDPEKERELADRKVEVEDRFNRLLAPLIERRKKLDQIKRVKQVTMRVAVVDK